ncbi:MAG: nucleotidyltransferase family protein [Turicibacter sp.]|nr:nucleotidyltransferase family protein [Turicibacter sp.]
MKISGIISEYNPFHSGHLGHLEQTKIATGADFIVSAMSGNFVQRGEPAIFDKWRRTEMALNAGVDLVLELPVSTATAAAGYFAENAVFLLAMTNIIDFLSFGSECGDLGFLQKCTTALDNDVDLRVFLKTGLSFPAARAKAAGINLSSPNDVLGVEYLRALSTLQSDIIPVTVPRSTGAAKDVRLAIKAEKSENFADLDNLSQIFSYLILTDIEKTPILDLSADIKNSFRKYSGSGKITEIIRLAKSKNYTYTRLQRAALHLILGISKVQKPQYIRVLGFRKQSAILLKLLQERAKLPVVMNLKNGALSGEALTMLDEEVRTTKIYGLSFGKPLRFNEYSQPLIIV